MKEIMRKLLPLHILIVLLITLTLWSTISWNGSDTLVWLTTAKNIAALAVSGFLVRLFIRHLMENVPPMRQEHRIITLLILFLLFDPLNPWWIFLILGAVTELCQYFFRSPLGPIFNPAALGALILSVLGYLPSWWGVNPAPRFTLLHMEGSAIAWLLAFGFAYVAYKYRKLSVVLATILAFSISYIIFIQQSPLPLIINGTLLFFILVMTCEPKTSPNPRKEQWLYGSIIGFLVSLGFFLNFLEASLIALLIANLYTSRVFLIQLILPKPSPQTKQVA